MYGLDAAKYPARMGKTWKHDETVQILASIQKKKSIEEIAKEHERTVGSINSYIRKLARDYHFNDKRSVEEIQKFTGLTKEQIEETIKKSQACTVIKETRESKISAGESTEPTMSEIVIILKDIQSKLDILLEKVK